MQRCGEIICYIWKQVVPLMVVWTKRGKKYLTSLQIHVKKVKIILSLAVAQARVKIQCRTFSILYLNKKKKQPCRRLLALQIWFQLLAWWCDQKRTFWKCVLPLWSPLQDWMLKEMATKSIRMRCWQSCRSHRQLFWCQTRQIWTLWLLIILSMSLCTKPLRQVTGSISFFALNLNMFKNHIFPQNWPHELLYRNCCNCWM